MISRDFVYWLQGFFEISEATGDVDAVTLTAAQADMVRKHLSLVVEYETNPTLPFVQWLIGFMDAAKTPDKAQVETIRAKLNDVFKHVIDPPMGDAKKQKKLNEIHSPHPFQGPQKGQIDTNPGDFVVRC
jgi:hypothetical protein